MKHVLRPIVTTDARLLAALHRDFEAPWDEPSFATLLATPGIFGFLAGAREPEGFILCRVAADEAEVLTLFVPEPLRRQGIAKALLAQAFTTARAAGAKSMFLEVAESNAAARGLYVAHGFAEVGRRPRYYRDGADALILRRDL